MAFWDSFLSSGIEGAAEGLGSLAKDIRAAITGEEPVGDETRLKLEEIAANLETGRTEFKTTLVTQVNETMRAESQSEHWMQWAWRPFWGFISALAFAFVAGLCGVLGYKAVLGDNPAAMASIPQLIGAYTALFSIPGAILGVTAWHRGKQKRGM